MFTTLYYMTTLQISMHLLARKTMRCVILSSLAIRPDTWTNILFTIGDRRNQWLNLEISSHAHSKIHRSSEFHSIPAGQPYEAIRDRAEDPNLLRGLGWDPKPRTNLPSRALYCTSSLSFSLSTTRLPPVKTLKAAVTTAAKEKKMGIYLVEMTL
jgi:hypothetical protein